MDSSSSIKSRALPNAVAILNALALHGQMDIARLSEVTEIPRPSVYRVIEALDAMEFINLQNDGKASLATKLLRFGAHAQDSIPEVKATVESLDNITKATGHTSHFSALRGSIPTILAWREGSNVGLPALRPGTTLPLFAGSATFTLLANDEAPEPPDLPLVLPALTPRTNIDREDVLAKLKRDKENGFSASDEDVNIGIAALSVPVMNREGQTCGALTAVGLRKTLLPAKSDILPLLFKEADAARDRLPRR